MISKKVNFVMAIHCHQPVGNFNNVFVEAYEKSYKPFFDILERHPKIRVTLHYSGPLLDWFVDNKPEFLDRIKKLIKNNQIELMTGGYYEPILAMISHRDRIGQIELMSSFIKKNFSSKPAGAWLAERVWEPQLAKSFSEAGVLYTIVDDMHFKLVGKDTNKLCGYYVTESEGKSVFIFAGSQKLRYTMPFRQPHETIEVLRSFGADEDVKEKTITFADDGEKFGLWPGTHKWVYQEAWLDRFFNLLEENLSWIDVTTFRDVLETRPPSGRIYLPCASYAEMLEWSNGYFMNFFAKYEEANNMHKKMLYVSEKINLADKSCQLNDARRHLYMGQCNCAYWHGVFGGLYLNHLRSSVYSNLIKAETLLEKAGAPSLNNSIFDFNKDGKDEAILETDDINLYITPERGGTIFEFDIKDRCVNLFNTLMRRFEPYHEKLKSINKDKPPISGNSPLSIHDIVNAKEKNLEKFLCYDKFPRFSFRDHFFRKDLPIDNLFNMQYEELGDFADEPYECKIKKSSVDLFRKGVIKVKDKYADIELSKSYSIDKSTLNISYSIKNVSKELIDVVFGIELNLCVQSDLLKDRNIILNKQRFEIHDNWYGLNIECIFNKDTNIYYYPVETVSDSESGLERSYQGLSLLFSWPIFLNRNQALDIIFTVSYN